MTDSSLSFLDSLNPQQRLAVTAPAGAVLVLAGPGSGKTRVLTYRIAYLLQAERIRPYHVLAVTFTNKAAREMKSRLEKLLGEEAGSLWLGTFHAACARILRVNAEKIGLQTSFVIFDADDQEGIVKRAIRDLKLDEKLYRPVSIHAAISAAKNELLTAEDYPRRNYRDEIVARVYTRYQELLRENSAVDFDDLLLLTVQLFEQHPLILERYSQRFRHILVDEFQDTNKAQYQIVRLLSKIHGNLFVVGDEDQSIYRWRGADYHNVQRFEEDYPDCQKILLEQNYRSTQNVLDVAQAVIDRNRNRTPKNLFTQRGAGERITLYEAVDDYAEAAYVVDTIQQQVSSGQASGSDFAVMYRTNAQSRLLEEAFLRAGMKYHLVGAQRFYGRREVKDLVAFLRLVQNPRDSISLGRVINVPPRGVGDKTLLGLQTAAVQANLSAGDILLDLGEKGSDSPYFKTLGRGAIPLVDFGGLLIGWRMAATSISLPALFDRIVAETTYQSYIDDGSEEGADRWENVQELRRLAYEFSEQGLGPFLENVALVSDQDTVPEQAQVPTLLTLHAAKGLEFSQVFIVGLDDGLLPHSRAVNDGDQEEMAEERRLFYVGITRARNRLYLVRSDQRRTYGSSEATYPSRFLSDIPSRLLQERSGHSWGRSAEREERRSRYGRWESGQTYLAPSGSDRNHASESTPPLVKAQFRAGLHVRHPIWGEGLVIDARLEGEDERVDVFFESVGFKRLIAAMARLEIIS